MKLEWKEVRTFGFDGWKGYHGTIAVAGVSWKSGTQSDPKSSGWVCKIYLPDIKPKEIIHTHISPAQLQAQNVLAIWLKRANLTEVQ